MFLMLKQANDHDMLQLTQSHINSSTMSFAASRCLTVCFFSCPQDREYLQEEKIFLDDLKKKSYRLSFNAH